LGFDAASHPCSAEVRFFWCNGFADFGDCRTATAAQCDKSAAASEIMNPPNTYAEWAAGCDRLLKGDCDEDTIAAMEAGSLEWTSGVAERITRRIHEVFDSRLKLAGEHFQRDTNYAHGHATLLTNALLGIRKKMILLARLAALPALPDMVKQSLQQSLQQFAERTQSSLESSARADRTGKTLDLVKRNRICVPDISSLPARDIPSRQPDFPTTNGTTHTRRIILT
jgi:hypothetical protein